MKKRELIEYYGSLGDIEDQRDLLFWSSLSTAERFSAAWEIVRDYYIGKGLEDELRFRRSIETAGEI